MEDQLKWEEECVRRGTQRYFDLQNSTRESGNELTDATNFILRDRLQDIADSLKDDCKKGAVGRNASYNKLVRQIAGKDDDYLKVGFIGLQYVLIYLARGKKTKVTKLVSVLGTKFEAELKCQMFEAENPAYYHTVKRSLKEQGVSSAEHRQKVLMKKFNDFEFGWTDWTTKMKVHVGTRVFRNVLKVMDDLIFLQKKMLKGKTDFYVDTTASFDNWVAEFETERGLLFPLHLPLKSPPRQWEDISTGAYWTPRMQLTFIKNRGKEAKSFARANDPKQHRKAVNKMQQTEWQINTEVLKVQEQVFRGDLKIGMPSSQPLVMTPFPERLEDVAREDYTERDKEEILAWKMIMKRQYDEERQRKGKVISFRQSHLLAQELRDWDRLYFAYNCDFRGRVYCATAGLSPQGSDDAKGLLRFAKPVQLGESGIKWLAIQGANVFGEDKLPYDGRVQWVKENEQLIKAIVEDPITHTMWGEADKPYQFLAFCFEWARSDYGRNPKAMGHLPVGLDGSCNGLQHFSAMLRDEVGARATNLTDCDKPEDIYGEVANVTTEKLKVLEEEGSAYAKIWLQVGVTRKCAKKPVMTLPYGAKQQSARNYVFEYVIENWSKFNMEEKYQWDMAKFLTPIMWAAISEVVIAARTAMDWLMKNVGEGYCYWTTIIGFPVYQHYKIDNIVDVQTQLEGNVRLYVPDFSGISGIAYKAGQRSGIAPNFIHSIDSTHMVLTINCVDLHSYAMVHDDFGTHAGNTDKLFKAIRKSFKYMYSNTDPLKHWANQMEKTTRQPRRGAYNIEDITNATYFFG